MGVEQPLFLHEDVLPAIPSGWHWSRSDSLVIQLKPGKLFDTKTVAATGAVPVLNQSESGALGYHDEEPGVVASPSAPVVTFANHTCAMRLVRHPFSAIQNIFPKVGRQAVCDTVWFYYALLGRVRTNEYKGHHPLFRDAFVPVPPIATQRRIASILSAFDDLIEINTQRIAILEEMARRIYEEWFVRFRFPGHENVRMVESELGLVPEGWRVRALGDFIDDVRDSVNPDAVSPETPYVGLEHIPRRSIALAEWGHAAEVGSSKLRFREGDILFGKIRPYFHKVAVAPVAGVASSDAIVMRAKQAQDFGLALAVASSDAFVAHATQTSNGTKMPRANWGVLRQYPVPTPPPALHKRFEEFMAGVVSAVANHVLRNRNLRVTRDLLLPKLVSGELDVSALPEPEALAA